MKLMTDAPVQRFSARTSKQQMITTLTVVTAVFGLFLVAFVAFTGWSANDKARDREWDLIDNALSQALARVLNEQKSIAWWDDAVVNVRSDPRSEWVQTEFGVYLSETYGHAETYIID